MSFLNLEIEAPAGYTYLQEEIGVNSATFRIKEVKTEASANLWISQLSAKTNVVWRVQRTYPSSGKINVFKQCYMCECASDSRVKGIRATKKTDCKATLQLTVKKRIKKSKAKNKSPFDDDWPTVVRLNNNHNHTILPHTPQMSDASLLDIDSDSEEEEELRAEPGVPRPELTVEEEDDLDSLFVRIREGLDTNPYMFVPAVRSMLQNVERYGESDGALLLGLHVFCTGNTIEEIGAEETVYFEDYTPGNM